MSRRLFLLTACLLWLAFAPAAWADHGAPAPQLGGVKPCLESASVQLSLEAVTLPGAETERVRAAIYEYLRGSLQKNNIAYDDLCSSSPSFVLLGLYVRYLEPETYVGFPPNSYTYVTTGQVGQFSPRPTTDTVLTPSRYAASVSEIFQAATSERLARRLIVLAQQEEVDTFIRTWLLANTLTTLRLLPFAALGLLLAGLRVLTRALVRVSR